MSILVVAAHPDDEVLGCGASVAKWTEAGNEVHILILAEGATSRDAVRNPGNRIDELSALAKAAHSSGDILGVTSVRLLNFPDNRLDSVDLLDVIIAVEEQIKRINPETVCTHHSGDLNIDHRITHQAVVTACRPQPGQVVRRLLSFEVPSSTEWQPPDSGPVFQPNWFEDVSITLDRKLQALEIYTKEMRPWPHSRSFQAVDHLARWRGSSVGCEAAEAFILLREVC
ncbi:MAG TPA: PIG-L family deacetylase [Sulfurimonas sp.]|nr:PIG-L family deacetylase [Sulfurimonas sp.]